MRIESRVVVLALFCAEPAFAAGPPVLADARPELLKALDGHWVMKGDVMGESVTYSLVAGPALQGRFTELRMQDVQDPPQYEARVFIEDLAEYRAPENYPERECPLCAAGQPVTSF